MFHDSLYTQEKLRNIFAWVGQMTLTGNSHLCVLQTLRFPILACGVTERCWSADLFSQTDGRRQAFTARGARRQQQERLSEPSRAVPRPPHRAGAATAWGPARAEQHGAERGQRRAYSPRGRAARARTRGRAHGTGTARGCAHRARAGGARSHLRTASPTSRDRGAPRGNSDWL